MKLDVLRAVDLYGSAEAVHIAAEIGMPIEGVRMALLRAWRAGLLMRSGMPGREPFTYALTNRGLDRLAFLEKKERTRRARAFTANFLTKGDR
jgi:DNA-binding transcriptional regulator PaaX